MQKTGELEKRNSFKNFDLSKLKRQKPPKDSSLETFREIKELSKIKDDPQFVKDNDDMMRVFGNFATKNNYKFPEKIVKDMALDAYDNVIKKLKFHFNRPFTQTVYPPSRMLPQSSLCLLDCRVLHLV